jgi:hypothetical protein
MFFFCDKYPIVLIIVPVVMLTLYFSLHIGQAANEANPEAAKPIWADTPPPRTK